ncbi:hypothetical protein DE146DRAFT_136229 [Phaeosphaeria sp. MPI-PUGE-AT-0046c]|nr:hypothetical protein DE146DRAFT_136229 [Phaeosphaeria sp. MPI-PUGE-AT-0046c]
MRVVISVALQGILVALALTVTILRCWIKLRLDRRKLSLPEYFAWGAWVFTLGWFICSAIALHIQIHHPLASADDPSTDSVPYLVTVFVGEMFFDMGMYFPKASILSFYWWLIPIGFRRLRVALYIGTAYATCAFVSSFLMNMLIAAPISNNWSIQGQYSSLWNSLTAVIVNWCLNFSTDLLVFVLPFFFITCLQLRKRQKLALCGVFSLGLITMVLSLSRFIVFTMSTTAVDDASGNLWFTAEMATATIVVSLPALKPLIMKVTPHNTTHSEGHIRSSQHQSLQHKHRTNGSTRLGVENEELCDDEIQLVLQESRKTSLSATTRTINNVDRHESGGNVKTEIHVNVVGKDV